MLEKQTENRDSRWPNVNQFVPGGPPCITQAELAEFQKLQQLEKELREKVAQSLGKPLKPEVVRFVSDLPKTRNAKVMRRVIRAAYLNQEAGDLSALENPLSLEEIRRAAGWELI